LSVWKINNLYPGTKIVVRACADECVSPISAIFIRISAILQPQNVSPLLHSWYSRHGHQSNLFLSVNHVMSHSFIARFYWDNLVKNMFLSEIKAAFKLRLSCILKKILCSLKYVYYVLRQIFVKIVAILHCYLLRNFTIFFAIWCWIYVRICKH